jgi:hypothetical protein
LLVRADRDRLAYWGVAGEECESIGGAGRDDRDRRRYEPAATGQADNRFGAAYTGRIRGKSLGQIEHG